MAKYRKIVEIEAFQYDGMLMNPDRTWHVPDWAVRAYKIEKLFYGYEGLIGEEPPVLLFVKTAKGRKLINVGDYVILRDNGEISPCNPSVFELTYENINREKKFCVRNYDEHRLRRGITRFVSEFTKQTYEDASENNCEMVDWIIYHVEKEFEGGYEL